MEHSAHRPRSGNLWHMVLLTLVTLLIVGSCTASLVYAQDRDSIVVRDSSEVLAYDAARGVTIVRVFQVTDTIRIPGPKPPSDPTLPAPLPPDLVLARLTDACRARVLRLGAWYGPSGQVPDPCAGLYAPKGTPQPPRDSTPQPPRDTVPVPPRDTTPAPPPPSGGALAACTARPGWTPLTYQEFDQPIGYGSRDANGWIEQTGYSPRLAYSNGIVTGTWRKGLPGGVGPFNFGYSGRQVRDLYHCFRFRLPANMTIPNNGLKQGFWHGGGVNHVFMFKNFPIISAQFGPPKVVNGWNYTTTELCAPPSYYGAKNDPTHYTERPKSFRDLRDGQWHVLQYRVTGGTPGQRDASVMIVLDGELLCQGDGAPWYAQNMPGFMTGIDFNPNSSAGGHSSGPVQCPRPAGSGNAPWCTTETVDYDFVYIEGR